MKYFLTGATGFIGGRLAHLLREKGHEVVALVRNPEKATELAAMGVQLAPGDISDPASMRAPMQGCDGVFHVAGWYKVGVRHQGEGQRINVEGTRNVLTLMKELGIPKGVYTSTLAINSDTHGQMPDETYHFQGTHLSEYDRSKAAAHQIAVDLIGQGLPLVVVMPGLVYGPGDTSAVRESLLKYFDGKLPVIPSGTTFAWGHVDDVAQAHLSAMEKGRAGEPYIICGPPHTFVEAMAVAARISGKKMPMIVPGGMLRVLAPLMGLLEKFLPVPQDFTAENLRVTGGVTYIADNSKAKRELGYAPRPFEDGWPETVRMEWEDWKKKGK